MMILFLIQFEYQKIIQYCLKLIFLKMAMIHMQVDIKKFQYILKK